MKVGDQVLVHDPPLFLGFAALEWGLRAGQRGCVAEVDDPLVRVEFPEGPGGWFPASLLDLTD